MKRVLIVDSIYETDFWLIWDCQKSEADKFIEKKYRNTKVSIIPDDYVDAATIMTDENVYALWIKNRNFAKYPSFAIDHELVHVVTGVFRIVGMSLKQSTEEAYAYYFQYLKRKIWKELFPPKKKKVKKK